MQETFVLVYKQEPAMLCAKLLLKQKEFQKYFVIWHKGLLFKGREIKIPIRLTQVFGHN